MINVFNILPNNYYIFKIYAEAQNSHNENSIINAYVKFYGSNRNIKIELPVLIHEDIEQIYPKKYLERYFIFCASITESFISLYSNDDSIILHGAIQQLSIDLISHEQYFRFQNLIKDLYSTTIQIGERTWPIFLGLDSLKVLPDIISHHKSSSLINTFSSQKLLLHSDVYIACWGDDLFIDTISQNFNVESINIENLYLLFEGIFSAILIQKRSTKIREPNSDIIINAIKSSNIQIFIVEDEDNGTISIKSNKNSIELYGHEYDMLNIVPSNRIGCLSSIAVHGASDLYQFEEFQNIVDLFITSGYNITIFESTYSHQTRVSWKRFKKNRSVKVFSKLSLTEQVSIFRHCAFVLICSYSLRNPADWLTVACAALMSGSIPIVIGQPSTIDHIFDNFFSFEACYSYIHNIDSIIFHKIWISKFRSLMRLFNSSSIRTELYSLISGNMYKDKRQSAEIICVTKRPENISIIEKNICRQTYKNLTVHIIWNVPSGDFNFCKEISKKIKFSNIRVSCISSQYNIGYCLNYAIAHTEATHWFKMDDDDFYGAYYIEDMMLYYSIGNFDAVFKPSFFIAFKDNSLYARKITEDRALSIVEKDIFGCGATLSGNSLKLNIPFSNTFRNSNDSEWQKELWNQKARVFIGDMFNYCIRRQDIASHTWQVSNKQLKKESIHLGNFNEEWINAN